MMMNLVKLILITGIFLTNILAQDATLTIDPNDVRLKLGFIDFQPQPGETKPLPVDPGRVLYDDLEFSGRIIMIEGLNADETTLNYFMKNEALAYVHGDYVYNEDQIQVNCYLSDSETKEVILGKQYTASKKQLRDIAHKFSDELIYQLFGERGIAQTKIVFTSKQSGKKQIFTMDYDGANTRRVTRNGSVNLLPCWLKDNLSVIFTSYIRGTPQLFKMAIYKGKEKIFSPSKFMSTGSDYNVVDEEIVYTSSVDGNSEIFRISEDGTNRARLTYSRSIETSPSWSPNGYEISFTSNRSGSPMIYIMDRDGSNLRRVTYEGKYNTSPSWSPKGDKIAFCSMQAGGRMDIFTISPSGKDLRKLTFGRGSNESPSWSPDGRSIVFSSNRLGRTEVYRMWEDGSHQKKITNFGQNSSPNWSHF